MTPRPLYEAYNGDLFEIYVDNLGEVKRVIVYRDREGPGIPLGRGQKLPPEVEERILRKTIKRLFL